MLEERPENIMQLIKRQEQINQLEQFQQKLSNMGAQIPISQQTQNFINKVKNAKQIQNMLLQNLSTSKESDTN